MTRVVAGATLDRWPGSKYVGALGFCELELSPPLPRVATAARWREASPGPGELSLLAPPPCVAGPAGPLRLDTALVDALEWLADLAGALDARFVVVRTPPTVSPGVRSRERLAEYVGRLRDELAETTTLVWHPSGPWEPDEAQLFGERLGLRTAVDPLEGEPAPAPRLYCRLEAAGARPRFGEGVLEALLDRLDELEVEEAHVALRSPRSFREAVRLQELARGREP